MKTCKTCGAKHPPKTGAHDMCPTCYQRARRLARGEGTAKPGQDRDASVLTAPGARELRALCEPKLVKLVAAAAKSANITEADWLRRALRFAVAMHPGDLTRSRLLAEPLS